MSEDYKKLSGLLAVIEDIKNVDKGLKNLNAFEDYIHVSVEHCYQALVSSVAKLESLESISILDLVQLKQKFTPKINVLRDELAIIGRDHCEIYGTDFANVNEELSKVSSSLGHLVGNLEQSLATFENLSRFGLITMLSQTQRVISDVCGKFDDEKVAFAKALDDEDFRLLNFLCRIHRNIEHIIASRIGFSEYLAKGFGYFDDLSNFEDDQPSNEDDQPSNEDDQPSNEDDQPSNEDDQPSNEDDQPSNEDDQALLEIISFLLKNPAMQSDVLKSLKKV